MRVLVVGAGIIGSIYGWALAESGHEVVHLVRSSRAPTLCNGVTLDVFDRRNGHKWKFCGLYKLNAAETLSPTDIFYALSRHSTGALPGNPCRSMQIDFPDTTAMVGMEMIIAVPS